MNAKAVKHHALTLFNAFQMRNGAIISSIAEIRAMRRPVHVHPVWKGKSSVTDIWTALCKWTSFFLKSCQFYFKPNFSYNFSGTDEIGCFGCAKHQYSCFSNNDEFQMSKFPAGSMCYSLDQKCDGITHCLNGRDEEECSMLIKSAELHTVEIALLLIFSLHFTMHQKIFVKIQKISFDSL